MRPQAIAEKARRGDKKGDLRECLDDLDAKLQAKEAEINEAAAAVQIHNLRRFVNFAAHVCGMLHVFPSSGACRWAAGQDIVWAGCRLRYHALC